MLLTLVFIQLRLLSHRSYRRRHNFWNYLFGFLGADDLLASGWSGLTLRTFNRFRFHVSYDSRVGYLFKFA